MISTWQPYQEPLRSTLLRTVIIALVIGAVLALRSRNLANWPIAALLALWPSFGGHWVEIFFLNWLRPRLPASRATQIAARLAVWFIGGIIIAFGLALSAIALGRFRPTWWHAWAIAGLAFIAIELLVHAALQLRRRPNFYNGRG
jgi:hypothetical protein